MKIRIGFVSNSSSSSFIIVGRKCDNVSKLTKADIKNGLHAIGKVLYEATDVFQITDVKMLDFVKKHSNLFKVFTDSVFIYDAYDANIAIGEKDVGKVICGGTADQGSSSSVEELKESYEGEDNNEDA